MAELWLVLALVGVPSLFGAMFLIDVNLLSRMGLVAVTIGVLVGFPGTLVYHVRLRRALKAQGAIPRGWIWRPTSFHRTLSPDERGRVLRPFLYGGIGFTLAMAGSFALIVAIARS